MSIIRPTMGGQGQGVQNLPSGVFGYVGEPMVQSMGQTGMGQTGMGQTGMGQTGQAMGQTGTCLPQSTGVQSTAQGLQQGLGQGQGLVQGQAPLKQGVQESLPGQPLQGLQQGAIQTEEEEYESRGRPQGELHGQEEGMYTQRGGWTPVQGQSQFGRMSLQEQGYQGQGLQGQGFQGFQGGFQGQGYQPQGFQGQGFQGQGLGQQQGVYRGGEWKHEREDEPIIVAAPPGPMPGKSRAAPLTRSPEERMRARRFGFPPTRLLVLTDGSDNAHRALEAALHFRRRNDSLFIVNAVQLMDDTVEYDQTNRLLKDKGRKIIDEVTKLIHEREIGRWECACLPAKNAKEAVLDYAQKHNIELIFVGSRGIDNKTGDFYPGSFSKHVIDNSHCSVMLVR